ncbi:nuclear transport factor 2 family protein [Alphaproteobacteria bacterium]|mgnify:FL=1|nr:nuclear transport factor 2 family protein [Alphaproteobacteria bacterium]
MSILEKYNDAFMNKDEAAMNEVLHDDYKFTMHASGNVLSKQDVIKWALSDDINRDKVRIVYENDEIGVEHAFVTFNDGNTQAVMAVFKFKDGQIISLETGATNMPK